MAIEALGYSRLWHLALALWPTQAYEEPERCWFAMLSDLAAYFDDTGSHDKAPVVGFCGFAAPVDQWRRFEHEWRDILKRPEFGLDYLHMKELRSGKGSFARFSNNLNLQRDLFDRIQRTIRCRTSYTVGVFIVAKDYDILDREYELRKRYPPMVMAAGYAVSQLVKWKNRFHSADNLAVVADQGMSDWGRIDDSTYEHFGFRLQPADVRQTPSLQASDHAAWECQRLLAGMVTGQVTKTSQVRGSYLALEKRFGGNSWFVLDEAEMRNLFRQQGWLGIRDAK